MAKFTIELRTLLNNSNVDVNSYMQNYPLYSFKKLFQNTEDFGKNYKGEQITNFRDYLNDKIYTHFYTHEIGVVPEARFLFFLERRMKEIMPFYNQRFESIDIEFNPLWNVDLTESFTHEVDDTQSGENSSTETSVANGSSKTTEDLEQLINNASENNSTKTPNLNNESVKAHMDTAQQPITPNDLKTLNYFSDGEYENTASTGTETQNGNGSETGHTTNDNEINVTNENEINNTNSSNSSSNSKRTETYTRKQEGSSAGYLFTQNIQEWRKIMINIPMEICNELEELFVQLF